MWNAKNVAFTGTATSWDEANNIPVVEREGIRFAFLNYTYGLNGYQPGEIEGYYVNLIDEERIRVDINRVREKADVIIAAMHWGTEYETMPNAYEKQYAQFLADQGVDLVLGSHPHVIQPMTWLEGESGNKTLVCYSLGNFAIQHSHPQPHNYLEGMLTCNFVRYAGQAEDGGADVRIEDVKWVPLVYHGEEGNLGVWPVGEYTEELAKVNPAFKDMDEPLKWMHDESVAIVNALGDEFEVA